VKPLSGAPLKGRLVALLTNVRQGWKSLQETNTLAYYENPKIADLKSFLTLAPRANVIKLFTDVIYEFS
jgi:hypothetical protein